MISHPADDTSAPDENEDTAIVENMMKSLAPCVRAFSPGAWASVRSDVPPVYMKFQPTPMSARARRKCATALPLNATAAPAAITITPAKITFSTPKRAMSDPVTKPGANMPTTCHEITVAAAA